MANHDYSNSRTLLSVGELFWSSETERKFVVACLRPPLQRKIEHFHVVVVHWRHRKCTKQLWFNCRVVLFCLLKLLLFWRSSCRHHRRCRILSSLWHHCNNCKVQFLACCSSTLQPFGEGLVTVTVPQLRRGENSLSLWNILNMNSPITSPVNTFVGHSDVVLEFQWRSQRLDGEPFMTNCYVFYGSVNFTNKINVRSFKLLRNFSVNYSNIEFSRSWILSYRKKFVKGKKTLHLEISRRSCAVIVEIRRRKCDALTELLSSHFLDVNTVSNSLAHGYLTICQLAGSLFWRLAHPKNINDSLIKSNRLNEDTKGPELLNCRRCSGRNCMMRFSSYFLWRESKSTEASAFYVFVSYVVLFFVISRISHSRSRPHH